MNLPDNDLGDWRVAVLGRVMHDIPPAYKGGPSHKAGSPAYKVTAVKHPKHNIFGFIESVPTALALSIALKTAREAKKLQSTLALENTVTPWGKGKNVAEPNIPHLFDFFEQSMSSAVFSFHALEVFSNYTIGIKTSGSMQIKYKNKSKYAKSKRDCK